MKLHLPVELIFKLTLNLSVADLVLAAPIPNVGVLTYYFAIFLPETAQKL